MIDTPDMFECRLVGYSKQSRKDGDWVEVRFHIHPDDVTPALAQAPLKTVFMVAAVPVEIKIKEKPKRSWDEIPLPEQAGIMCRDIGFQNWMAARSEFSFDQLAGPDIRANATYRAIQLLCNIKSRTELSPDNASGRAWMKLDGEYRQSQGLIAERTT